MDRAGYGWNLALILGVGSEAFTTAMLDENRSDFQN